MTTFVPARRMTPNLSARTEAALRWAVFGSFAFVVAVALFYPELAFAQDARTRVGESAQKAFDLVFEVVYWICAIAVVVCGLAATFGRMEWGRFGQIVAGIVVVFGAVGIVDYFK